MLVGVSGYEHSFALVLFAIFLACFAVHAAGGAAEFNQEQLAHGEQAVSVGRFLTTSQFWFQSLQNWQSEFFVVGAVALLGIRLRERGSPDPSRSPHPTARPEQANKLSFSAALSLPVPRAPNLAV